MVLWNESAYRDRLELSRNVQSKNTQNLKITDNRINFSEWSVAERRKIDAGAKRGAVRRRVARGLLPILCKRQEVNRLDLLL